MYNETTDEDLGTSRFLGPNVPNLSNIYGPGDTRGGYTPATGTWTDPSVQARRAAVSALYQKYLNRDPDPEGLKAHMDNPGGIAGVEDAIRNSPEYRSRAVAPPPSATAPTTTTPTTTTPSASPSRGTSGQTVTGWGFDAPGGGRKEFSYTAPDDYGGGYSALRGFRDMNPANFDDAAYGSAKYVFARAAQGLGEGAGGFSEADVDTVVARLNAQGIPAKKVDAYQIDLGLGEGPMQIRGSDNTIRWFKRDEGGEGGGGGESAGGGAGLSPLGNAQTVGDYMTSGDSLSNIKALLQALLSGNLPSSAVASQLKG